MIQRTGLSFEGSGPNQEEEALIEVVEEEEEEEAGITSVGDVGLWEAVIGGVETTASPPITNPLLEDQEEYLRRTGGVPQVNGPDLQEQPPVSVDSIADNVKEVDGITSGGDVGQWQSSGDDVTPNPDAPFGPLEDRDALLRRTGGASAPGSGSPESPAEDIGQMGAGESDSDGVTSGGDVGQWQATGDGATSNLSAPTEDRDALLRRTGAPSAPSPASPEPQDIDVGQSGADEAASDGVTSGGDVGLWQAVTGGNETRSSPPSETPRLDDREELLRRTRGVQQFNGPGLQEQPPVSFDSIGAEAPEMDAITSGGDVGQWQPIGDGATANPDAPGVPVEDRDALLRRTRGGPSAPSPASSEPQDDDVGQIGADEADSDGVTSGGDVGVWERRSSSDVPPPAREPKQR